MSRDSKSGRSYTGKSPVLRWVVILSAVIVLGYLCAVAIGKVQETLEKPEPPASSQAGSQMEPDPVGSEMVDPEPPVIPDPPVEPDPPVVEPTVPDTPPARKDIPYVDGSTLTDAEKLERIHISTDYPDDMTTFADKYSQVLDFVYDYPVKKDVRHEIDISGEVTADKVPLFIQWDDRWGYIPFGEMVIGTSGCGPVCLSMVTTYLLQDPYWSPDKVCEFATKNDYYYLDQGSKWSLITEGGAALGLGSLGVGVNEAEMKSQLDLGRPIISAVRAGDFTKGGHFIVITGYNEDGFTVNDPNSRDNSAKIWSFERLKPQIKAMWAMYKA